MEVEGNTPTPQLAMEDIASAVELLELAYSNSDVFADWPTLEKMVGVRNRLTYFLQYLSLMQAQAQFASQPLADAEFQNDASQSDIARIFSQQSTGSGGLIPERY